jgi:hypothetical protein
MTLLYREKPTKSTLDLAVLQTNVQDCILLNKH